MGGVRHRWGRRGQAGQKGSHACADQGRWLLLCAHRPQPLPLLLEGTALRRVVLVVGGLAVVGAAAAAVADGCRLQVPQAPPGPPLVALEVRASRHGGAAPALWVVHRLATEGEEPEGHRGAVDEVLHDEVVHEVVDERHQAEPLQHMAAGGWAGGVGGVGGQAGGVAFPQPCCTRQRVNPCTCVRPPTMRLAYSSAKGPNLRFPFEHASHTPL